MNNLIKDIAACERPYEKAYAYGIETLTDAELLAVILRNGASSQSSIDLANKVLNAHPIHKGLGGLNFLERNELTALKGIGNTKATELLAIKELSKRMNLSRLKEDLGT